MIALSTVWRSGTSRSGNQMSSRSTETCSSRTQTDGRMAKTRTASMSWVSSVAPSSGAPSKLAPDDVDAGHRHQREQHDGRRPLRNGDQQSAEAPSGRGCPITRDRTSFTWPCHRRGRSGAARRGPPWRRSRPCSPALSRPPRPASSDREIFRLLHGRAWPPGSLVPAAFGRGAARLVAGIPLDRARELRQLGSPTRSLPPSGRPSDSLSSMLGIGQQREASVVEPARNDHHVRAPLP